MALLYPLGILTQSLFVYNILFYKELERKRKKKNLPKTLQSRKL